jgi:hypothetical protein
LQFETTGGGALSEISNQNKECVLHKIGTNVMHEFALTTDADPTRRANETAASILASGVTTGN